MVGILVLFGTLCLVGATVGRRVKVRRKDSKLRGPLIASRTRGMLLAGVGAVCVGAGAYLGNVERDRPGRAGPPPAATAQLAGSSEGPGAKGADPVSGVWKALDGATVEFRRTGDQYEVKSSKPNGFADVGTASLKGQKVTMAFKNKYVGKYTAELMLAGNEMRGSYTVTGVQIPVVLKR